MKKLFIPAFMVAMLGFASCADDETSVANAVASDNEAIEAEAVLAEEGADFDGLSKTCLTDAYKYNFVGDEQMAMFHNKSKTKSILKNTLGTKGTSAKFSGTVTGGKSATQFYGIIPATAASSMSTNGEINVTIPAAQSAIEGTFDPTAHIYSSYSTKATTYSLKTVNSFLMIQNDGDTKRDFVKIVLKSNDGTPMAGDFVVTSREAAITKPGANQFTEITLTGDIKADQKYFIGLAPAEQLYGYTLYGYTADNNVYICKCGDRITFAKNGIKRVIPTWQLLSPSVNTLDKEKLHNVVPTDAKKIVFGYINNYQDVDGEFKGYVGQDGENIAVYADKDGVYYVLSSEAIYVPYDCSLLFNKYTSDLVFENFDISYLTSVELMFYMYNGMSLDLTSIDFSKVNNFSSMFRKSDVKTIKLPSIPAGDKTAMFLGCVYLRTIWVNDFSTEGNCSEIFNSCNNLEGQNGTVYKYPNTGGDYARIDGGESNPGYFTQMDAPAWQPVLTNDLKSLWDSPPTRIIMDYKTSEYSNAIEDNKLIRLTKGGEPVYANSLNNCIDVYVKNDAPSVYYFLYDGVINAPADCSGLFKDLNALYLIVLNNFKEVGNITNLTEMFYGCSSLTTIYSDNLQGPANQYKENTTNMFYGCINLRNYNPDKVDYQGTGHNGGCLTPCYVYYQNNEL